MSATVAEARMNQLGSAWCVNFNNGNVNNNNKDNNNYVRPVRASQWLIL